MMENYALQIVHRENYKKLKSVDAKLLGEVCRNAQHFGSLVIAVLALLYYSKRERPVIILAFYGINSVLFQFLNTLSPNTSELLLGNIVANVYTLTECLILLYFFNSLYHTSWAKKLTIIMSVVYSVLFFVLLTPDWQTANAPIRIIRDGMMIACSVLYFYFLLSDMPAIEITRYPMFWIVAAFIFFFAGTFMLSLSIDYLVEVLKDDLRYLWPARNLFRCVFCLVVSYGLWLDFQYIKM